MKLRVLFIDPDCPAAYTHESLQQKPMGGTEATIIRVTEGLALLGHQVTVAQGARSQHEKSPNGVEYSPFRLAEVGTLQQNTDAVVTLNTPKLLRKIRKAYPEAMLYLWMHCFPGKRRKKMINKYVVEADARIISVSETLKKHLEACLRQYPTYGRHSRTAGLQARVQTIYNPVDDQLQPNGKMTDSCKLVFFSSPHKGLDQVLKAFAALRKQCPAMRLCLASPGYWPFPPNLDDESVEILGTLSHAEVIEHVREAFCVFYPQSFFKETFGLVFAEANAVGTPVLTHPQGAAVEVLGDQRQLVDASDPDKVVAVMQEWLKNGRPTVQLNERFRLRQVLKSWVNLLENRKASLQKEQNEQKSKNRKHAKNQNNRYRPTGSGAVGENVA